MTGKENDMGIDWDKLLDAMDEQRMPANLSQEELELMADAKEMQARLSADKFSEETGWEMLQSRYRQKKTRVFNMMKLAAAVLLLIAGAGWWLNTTKRQTKLPELANQLPSGKVQLKLGNGQVLTINKDTLLRNSTVKIDAAQAAIVYEANANTTANVAPDTLDIPRGLQFSLRLADGTKVWLNAASQLIYPAVFNQKTRDVYVKGEAYFEVAPDNNHPFIVHAGNTSMKVLGTAFNVNNYTNDVVTTLATGKLQVTAAAAQTILAPNQQAVYNSKTGSLQTETVEANYYTAWKDGELFFEDATLQDIATSLERSYDYHFIFDSPATASIKFTLDMTRTAVLQDLLNQISQSDRKVRFQINGKTVTVSYQP